MKTKSVLMWIGMVGLVVLASGGTAFGTLVTSTVDQIGNVFYRDGTIYLSNGYHTYDGTASGHGMSRLFVEFNISTDLPTLQPWESFVVNSAELQIVRLNGYTSTNPAQDLVSHIVDTGTLELADYSSPVLAELGVIARKTDAYTIWEKLNVTSAVQNDLDAGQAWSSFRFHASDESEPAGVIWHYRYRTDALLVIDYTIVPEPGTVGLLMMGVLGWLIRRK